MRGTLHCFQRHTANHHLSAIRDAWLRGVRRLRLCPLRQQITRCFTARLNVLPTRVVHPCGGSALGSGRGVGVHFGRAHKGGVVACSIQSRLGSSRVKRRAPTRAGGKQWLPRNREPHGHGALGLGWLEMVRHTQHSRQGSGPTRVSPWCLQHSRASENRRCSRRARLRHW